MSNLPLGAWGLKDGPLTTKNMAFLCVSNIDSKWKSSGRLTKCCKRDTSRTWELMGELYIRI